MFQDYEVFKHKVVSKDHVVTFKGFEVFKNCVVFKDS